MKKSAAFFGAVALAVAPVAAPAPAFAQTVVVDRDTSNPLEAPGAGVGIALFGAVLVFMVLLGTETIFDDGDPVSP